MICTTAILSLPESLNPGEAIPQAASCLGGGERHACKGGEQEEEDRTEEREKI